MMLILKISQVVSCLNVAVLYVKNVIRIVKGLVYS